MNGSSSRGWGHHGQGYIPPLPETALRWEGALSGASSGHFFQKPAFPARRVALIDFMIDFLTEYWLI
ncbi:hypothetical protein, partial [Akkermansia sp.]